MDKTSHEYRLQRIRERGAMNEFERARDEYYKNKPHNDRLKARGYKRIVREPKEKPMEQKPARSGSDAVFDIRVYLPDGEMTLSITKPNIYANVPRAKVNQNQIRQAIANGLTTLLGAVK